MCLPSSPLEVGGRFAGRRSALSSWQSALLGDVGRVGAGLFRRGSKRLVARIETCSCGGQVRRIPTRLAFALRYRVLRALDRLLFIAGSVDVGGCAAGQ